MADQPRMLRCLRMSRRAAYYDGRLQITSTGRPPVLALAGQINEHNRTGMADTLSRLSGRHREIHISLRDVTSCELGGLRAIILLTGACSDDHGGTPNRLVVLHDVPPHLTSILRILGWDRTPGLLIAGLDRQLTTVPQADQARPAARQPGRRAALAFAHPITFRRAVAAGSRPGSQRTTA